MEDWYLSPTDEGGASGITVDLAAGLLETLSSSSDISGAELRFAEFDVELNSRGRLGYDITEDVVSLTFRFFAENVGPSNVLGCKRVEYTIAMELQLVQTDAAVESMDAVDFMERCHPDASGFGLFLLANRAIEDLRARTRPTCPDETLLPTERLGLVRYDDVDSIVLREDYSGSEGSPRAHILFLFSDLSGRPLGAHDVLVRTLSFEGRDFEADRCIGAVRKQVRDAIEASFRRELVLGVRDALLDAITSQIHGRAAEVFTSFRSDLNLLFGFEGGAVSCLQDADCNAGGPGGPAFQADGRWRGARHVCLARRPDGSAPPPADPTQRECFVQVEPDRINLRPDGFEIVLADFVDEDVQGDFFSAGSFLPAELCDPERDEYGDPAAVELRVFPEPLPPFRITSDDIGSASR